MTSSPVVTDSWWQSNPTYLVRAGEGGARLVLRKKPPGKLLPGAHQIEREYRVIQALGGAGVAGPRTRALCEDTSVLGTSFYIMDYVPGTVYKDPSLPELEPQQRAAVYSGLSSTLAAIHSVDIEKAGIADYGKHEGYVERQASGGNCLYRPNVLCR